MLLSIIVPAYNEENTIGQVLEALAREIPDAAEVIVVDDGSKDQTATIAEKYASLNPYSIRV